MPHHPNEERRRGQRIKNCASVHLATTTNGGRAGSEKCVWVVSCLEVFQACFQVKSSLTQEQGTVIPHSLVSNFTISSCCSPWFIPRPADTLACSLQLSLQRFRRFRTFCCFACVTNHVLVRSSHGGVVLGLMCKTPPHPVCSRRLPFVPVRQDCTPRAKSAAVSRFQIT